MGSATRMALPAFEEVEMEESGYRESLAEAKTAGGSGGGGGAAIHRSKEASWESRGMCTVALNGSHFSFRKISAAGTNSSAAAAAAAASGGAPPLAKACSGDGEGEGEGPVGVPV